MRPAGQIRQALMQAASELATPDRTSGPTMRELATHATVGFHAARRYVDDMCRAGQLRCISDRRKVPYRNRPVAEYLPADPPETADTNALANVFAAWAR